VGYTIFHAAELEWRPRREGDPRLAAELSSAMTQSRANLFRYPPGAVGRRHIDPVQEEVFVVLDGTLTIHMGEGDEPERHELAKGSVLVVQPGTALQLSNRHEDELRLFIVGAPPERGETVFLDAVSVDAGD
jgi:mannose-6-phosphate isomerase-like protein (cupin superfamily)